MERFIVNQLKWDLITITPIEYVDYLFNQIFVKIKIVESSDGLSAYKYSIKIQEKIEINTQNERVIEYNKIISHCRTLIFMCLIGNYFN